MQNFAKGSLKVYIDCPVTVQVAIGIALYNIVTKHRFFNSLPTTNKGLPLYLPPQIMLLKQIQTWFILVVFAFCQIPAGLWHEHELEVCVNPTHTHDEPEHACMVATVLPGNEAQASCGHSQHITTEKEHCKICKFEIAKYLESCIIPFEKDKVILLPPAQIIYIASHQEYLMRAANKGPPTFFAC